LVIEQLKALLREKDWPVYDLKEVIAYMDEKVKNEGFVPTKGSNDWTKGGWGWHPLREQDHRFELTLGAPASWNYNTNPHTLNRASNYYLGPKKVSTPEYVLYSSIGGGVGGMAGGYTSYTSYIGGAGAVGGLNQPAYLYTGRYIEQVTPSPIKVYDKPIPLHALKKVAAITKAFGADIGLFVSDYVPLPQYNPDPFLMAVAGTNCLVIDFWAEPGFGLEQQLK